jgi:hypothetical protein
MLRLVLVAVLVTAGPAAAAPTEDQVVDLLRAWVIAQTTGDRAAYEKLYASSFQGVRRSGQKAVTFDRAGWITDRAKMFARPMQVEAGKPAITIADGKALARFVQTWGSGTYRDTGNKEIVVVVEGGEARIAREELIDSKMLPRVVVRWTLTPILGAQTEADVTLEILGAQRRTYNFSLYGNCRVPAVGLLASGKESEVECGNKTGRNHFSVRHQGTNLIIVESDAAAGHGPTDRIHETYRLPPGADVLVEVVKGTPSPT